MNLIKLNDIFEDTEEGSVICITTNGIVKRDGCLVMGAGVAKQACFIVPGIDEMLGGYVRKYGNRCFNVGSHIVYEKKKTIASFPTKNHFSDKSDIKLIVDSAFQIVKMANKFNWTKIYIPAPGCGLGGLDWKDVKEAIESILDDRFYIVFKAK